MRQAMAQASDYYKNTLRRVQQEFRYKKCRPFYTRVRVFILYSAFNHTRVNYTLGVRQKKKILI